MNCFCLAVEFTNRKETAHKLRVIAKLLEDTEFTDEHFNNSTSVSGNEDGVEFEFRMTQSDEFVELPICPLEHA